MNPSGEEVAAGIAFGMMLWGLFVVGISIISIVAMWKVFSKAGKPGWAAIIPIYNLVVLTEVAEKPVWWVLLYFVPFANIVIFILVSIGVAEQFGKSTGFGVGLAFLPFVFFPMLAFGDAEYQSFTKPGIPRAV